MIPYLKGRGDLGTVDFSKEAIASRNSVCLNTERRKPMILDPTKAFRKEGKIKTS